MMNLLSKKVLCVLGASLILGGMSQGLSAYAEAESWGDPPRQKMICEMAGVNMETDEGFSCHAVARMCENSFQFGILEKDEADSRCVSLRFQCEDGSFLRDYRADLEVMRNGEEAVFYATSGCSERKELALHVKHLENGRFYSKLSLENGTQTTSRYAEGYCFVMNEKSDYVGIDF
jgi:hypothetical protein